MQPRGDVRTVLVLLGILSFSCTAQVPERPNPPVEAPETGLPGWVNAAAFGAKGDAATDDTVAIQKALDSLDKTGGVAYLPPRQYRIDGNLRVPTGVTLQGSWQGPHYGTYTRGTTLLAYGGRGRTDGPGLIDLGPSAGLRGVTLVWPEQTLPDVQPYPWAVRGMGIHPVVENVTLLNAYNGIWVGPGSTELHLIRNVFGCVLNTGILVDHCTDIGRIENVHFNPHYWARSGHSSWKKHKGGFETVARHVRANLEAFVFGRTDWEYVSNTFVWGAKVGYKFIKTKAGASNGQMLGVGADAVDTCVLAEVTQPMGWAITNGEFVAFLTENPVAIRTAESFTQVLQFNNCIYWGPSNKIADLAGPGTVTFQQNHFRDFDHQNKGLPAIDVHRGSVSIQNCIFAREGPLAVRLGEQAGPSIITGNLARGGIKIENASNAEVIIANNQAQPTASTSAPAK